MSEEKSLLVKRGGWALSVYKKDEMIIFEVEYKIRDAEWYHVDWAISQGPYAGYLLDNLEEAMDIKNANPRPIILPTSMIEWCVYPKDSEQYPFWIDLKWVWKSDDNTFHQVNRGVISLTKEEIDALRAILSA